MLKQNVLTICSIVRTLGKFQMDDNLCGWKMLWIRGYIMWNINATNYSGGCMMMIIIPWNLFQIIFFKIGKNNYVRQNDNDNCE